MAEIGSAPAPALAASTPVTAQSSGGGSGSSSTGLGLAALIGAGGAALLRARALFGATGLDDTGTLTALAHSASTMWAGSCYPVDGSARVHHADDRVVRD